MVKYLKNIDWEESKKLIGNKEVRGKKAFDLIEISSTKYQAPNIQHQAPSTRHQVFPTMLRLRMAKIQIKQTAFFAKPQ